MRRPSHESGFEIPDGSTMHELGVYDNYLELILNESKTLEVRNKFQKTADIKVGDYINFRNKALVKVKRVSEYKNIEEVLQNEEPNKILPGKSKSQLAALWSDRFPATNNPILVFEIELVKK